MVYPTSFACTCCVQCCWLFYLTLDNLSAVCTSVVHGFCMSSRAQRILLCSCFKKCQNFKYNLQYPNAVRCSSQVGHSIVEIFFSKKTLFVCPISLWFTRNVFFYLERSKKRSARSAATTTLWEQQQNYGINRSQLFMKLESKYTSNKQNSL